MKKSVLYSFSFFLLFIAQSAFAQWQFSGLPLGTAYDYCLKGGVLFVGTYGGVLKSTDTADTWVSPGNEGLPTDYVFAINATSTNLFAGLQYSGMYTSSDNGNTWTPSNNGLPPNNFGTNVITDIEISGSNVLVSITGQGVYRSGNNGASWVTSGTGLPSNNTSRFAHTANYVFVSVGNSVSRSSDNGLTWTTAGTGLPSNTVNDLFADGNTVYAACGSSGVYKTADFGSNWVQSGFSGTEIQTVAASNGFIVAADYDSFTGEGILYYSPDSGTTVQVLPMNISISRYNEINFIGHKFVIAGYYGNDVVDLLTLTSTQANLGYSADVVQSMVKHDGLVYVASFQFLISIYNPTGTYLWNFVGTGLPYNSVKALASSGAKLYAGMDYTSGVYSSSDSGNTWQQCFTGSTITSLLIDGTDIYAGSNSNMGKIKKGTTTTLTGNFVTSATGFPPSADVYDFAKSSSGIYVASTEGLYSTSNQGANWSLVNSPGLPSVADCKAVHVDGNNVYAGYTGLGVYVSTNNGSTFSVSNNGLGNLSISALVTHAGKLYAGTNMGIYVSADNGLSWTASCLSTGIVRSFLSDGTTLYAGTFGRGMWINDGTTWVQEIGNGDMDVSVFPNPANESIKIHCREKISDLSIVDLNGREVYFKSIDNYTSIVNTQSMENGIYFVQLMTADKTVVRKVVVRH